MRRRTVRTLGLHDCDSVFEIFMRPCPGVYICIFLGVYLFYPRCLHFPQSCAASAVGAACDFFFFFFLLIFKAHFLDSSRAHGAPGDAHRFDSRARSSMAWLNQTFFAFRAACSDAWKKWRLFGNVLNTIKTSQMGGTRSARIKAHGDDGFLSARVMTSLKGKKNQMFYFTLRYRSVQDREARV